MPHLYIHWVSLLWWRYLGIPRWMECERQSVCPHLGNLMALCDVNYLTLDIFTVWLPPLYVPMAFCHLDRAERYLCPSTTRPYASILSLVLRATSELSLRDYD